jgi:transposase
MGAAWHAVDFREIAAFFRPIALLVRQTPPTVRGVMNMYQKGGIQLVTAMDSYHPASGPAQHRTSIIREFQSRPPASAKEAAARIEQWTGIKRSPQRVRIFMRTIGITFRKTAVLPVKADLEKQEEFKKNIWSLKSRGPKRASRCCCSWTESILFKQRFSGTYGVSLESSFAVLRDENVGMFREPATRSADN